MIADYNDQTKIIKVHTATTKGYKLGSTNATWKKIKQATIVSEPEAVFDAGQVHSGPNGEVFVMYSHARMVEVWHWAAPDFSDAPARQFSGDTLYLYAQIELAVDDDAVDLVRILHGDMASSYTVVVAVGRRLELHKLAVGAPASTLVQPLPVPDYMDAAALTVKANAKFVVVADAAGFMFLYKKECDKYVAANVGDSLKATKKSSSLPILRKHSLVSRVGDDEVVLQTSCAHGVPIFDLMDNWLAYSPKKAEYTQIKIDCQGEELVTPVKLPSAKPLLNKVLESLSNTALDSLFRLSKYSTTKISHYLNNDKDISMNSIKGALNKMVHSTISSINESAKPFTPNDNQLVKIIDLSNDKVLSIFKPPDGVSNLSLSPYDLQLVNGNTRGDSFFMWDLLKLPKEISLIGKFSRGKTSGSVSNIFWFINHNLEGSELTKGTNSGFGCINDKTGSVHWFNINYLLGNMNNNLPNYLGKDFQTATNDKNFLNSWILSSSSKYKKFLTLPDLSSANKNGLSKLNQLAVLDEKNQIRLISPLNGSNSYKFELPLKRTDPQLIKKKPLLAATAKSEPKPEITPVSQIEIETSKPFMNFINYAGVQFSAYNFENSESDFENLRSFYNDLDQESVPTKKIMIAHEPDATIENETLNQVFDDLLLAQ